MIEAIKSIIYNDPEPTWLDIAARELGVMELRGAENPKIIEYHSTTQLKATEDEVSWCSSFVNWVMMKSGYQRTHSAAARSWLSYGRKLGGFKKGAIVIFKRGSQPWQGHVAFAVKEVGDRVTVLGGNQSDSVSYASYPKSKVIAYVYPTQNEKIV